MKFSKLTGCFYPENIGYAVDAILDDAITVSNETFIAAMNRPVGTQFDVHRGVLVIAPAASLSIPQVKEKVWQCIKKTSVIYVCMAADSRSARYGFTPTPKAEASS